MVFRLGFTNGARAEAHSDCTIVGFTTTKHGTYAKLMRPYTQVLVSRCGEPTVVTAMEAINMVDVESLLATNGPWSNLSTGKYADKPLVYVLDTVEGANQRIGHMRQAAAAMEATINGQGVGPDASLVETLRACTPTPLE
jgi:hypothetical protein